MKKFTENEIPYEDFERMGFSQEMIDDLPETIMNRLLSGEKTPLLSSSKNDSKDNPMKATIWMSREENGVVTGFYRPYDNVRDYSDFSKKQQKTLLSGGVVLTELKGQPSSYYQMAFWKNLLINFKIFFCHIIFFINFAKLLDKLSKEYPYTFVCKYNKIINCI